MKVLNKKQMVLNSLNNFIKLTVLYQLLFSYTKIKAQIQYDLKDPPCIGKHQIDVEKPANIVQENFEPIEFKNFDKIPSETILGNNAHVIVINMKYDMNDTIPTVKINFEQTLGASGTFRLEFLYFQWFRTVAATLAYKNLTFPGEFHGLFYNVEVKTFERALSIDKAIIILAFQVQVKPLENQNFAVLQENLKHVQEMYNQTAIPNHNLDYWLQADKQNFYVYEASFQYVCLAKVIFIDFTDVLTMSPEMVKEFQKLKAHKVKPLMMEIPETIKPEGTVFKSANLADQPGPADYYYDYDDDEEGNPVIQMIVLVLFLLFSLLLIIRVYKYW